MLIIILEVAFRVCFAIFPFDSSRFPFSAALSQLFFRRVFLTTFPTRAPLAVRPCLNLVPRPAPRLVPLLAPRSLSLPIPHSCSTFFALRRSPLSRPVSLLVPPVPRAILPAPFPRYFHRPSSTRSIFHFPRPSPRLNCALRVTKSHLQSKPSCAHSRQTLYFDQFCRNNGHLRLLAAC